MPPPDLYERYLGALTDPELTHHRDSVALVDSLIDEVLEGYEFGANSERWAEVKRLVRRVEAANKAGDRHKAREAFEELLLVVEEGHAHAQKSLAIVRLLEARRRHADSETRRRLSEELTFTYETAYAYYTALGAAARKHFGHDQKALTAFLNDVTAISGTAGVVDVGDRQALPPGP